MTTAKKAPKPSPYLKKAIKAPHSRDSELPSVVADTSYNAAEMVLTVFLSSGGIYNYLGVPADTFKEMQKAPSKGEFYNKEIKGLYEYEKAN